MPKPNPNFVIGLGVMIIILLGSTWPKHFNSKILHVSLIPSHIRLETNNATQKIPQKWM